MFLFRQIRSSLILKITAVTVLGLILALSIIGFIVVNRINDLGSKTLSTIEDELYVLANEYYENYLNGIAKNVEDKVHGILDELHLLSGITQSYMNQRDALAPISKSLNTFPYFRDDLYFSGDWYQNRDYEPATLFIPKYLLQEDNTIPENIQSLIDDTRLLELLLPTFASQGTPKVQAYFQGGQMHEIFRLAPWSDIGTKIFDVYPELNTLPIWDTFNPGLAEQWRTRIQEAQGDMDAINQLARVTPPVQDGLTGDVVLTFSQPIVDFDSSEFLGSISFDVPITSVIESVESVQISENGFAFLAQSNGNIFAINERGLDIFGLAGDESSTVDATQGFNRLERFLKDSLHPELQSLQFPKATTPEFGNLVINGESYIMILKTIDGYQSWSPSQSFYQENWTLGFVVPRSEIFHLYDRTEAAIENELVNTSQTIALSAGIIVLVLIILIYLLNQRMTRRLNTLALAAHDIQEKNYDVTIDVSSTDEVGALSKAFNAMVVEIRNSFQQMDTQNRQLKEEIEERKKKDKIISYLENFDAATDLPNKKALLNVLKDLKDKKGRSTSLIHIGLDDFRRINEAFSWKFGDLLIKTIAGDLQQVSDQAMLFKLSGDEFAVLYETKDLQDLMQQIHSIQACFDTPFTVESKHVQLSCSIGVSTYPYDSADPLDIFKYATTAMVHAKEARKGEFSFYDDTMNDAARSRMEMISELRSAMIKDEFHLVFQPILRLTDHQWTGMEVLIRWTNEKLGVVSPSTFIPVVEETRMIIEIGEWVLNEAFQQTKSMHNLGFEDLTISINVSIIQIMESDMVKVMEKALRKSQINPSRVNIEITEGIFIEDVDYVTQVLNGLRGLGVSISIDDFGTGYSSLSYINSLPLSKLKVDRAFVMELDNEKGREIATAIVGLAHNLNMAVVAEGIETKDQEKFLMDLQCAEGQGYMYGKPMSYGAFLTRLTERKGG